MVQPDGRIVVRRSWLALLGAVILLVPSVTNCGGRSSRVGGDGDDDAGGRQVGGDGGSSTGGVPAGGVSPTGVPATGGVPGAGGVGAGGVPGAGGVGASSMAGMSGTGIYDLCYLPLDRGSCDAIVPSYYFDQSTGVCMPFDYGGCDGNLNRFDSAEVCYQWCGGRGAQDLAFCGVSADCKAVRVVEPCCRTDVRDFVGLTIGNALPPCDQSALGCSYCAADCATVPQDGYIPAYCATGHCVAHDYRAVAIACDSNDDCYLRYGMECCTDCDPGQYPSKLVALRRAFDLDSVTCGEAIHCLDACDYSANTAVCVDNKCTVAPILTSP